MQPLPELVNGLEVLKPLLLNFGFSLDNYESGKGSGGKFTRATFAKDNKKFIIGYRYSVGYVVYECDKLQVSHDFYLDGLGFAEQKQFPDFQSDDKLLAFRYILHDLEFLVDDFFLGGCSILKVLARQQKEMIEEYNRKAQEEYKYQVDRRYINKARQEFKSKNYKNCLDYYCMVQYGEILSNYDRKAIEYCKRHK
ncbi:hypothetical protein GCM10027275_54000 [Rhabdobacter roseus]|uniref:Uncharacterized protein n=1 Tax=Rhabdobacter roseus TaxID=1655419 RepID=A0A840U5L5_9BACT|nr:hypothetical protein [Rhabdobacter roseus]MBB5287370.1 hypothetical protein [Rhabdobacter roseus]